MTDMQFKKIITGSELKRLSVGEEKIKFTIDPKHDVHDIICNNKISFMMQNYGVREKNIVSIKSNMRPRKEYESTREFTNIIVPFMNNVKFNLVIGRSIIHSQNYEIQQNLLKNIIVPMPHIYYNDVYLELDNIVDMKWLDMLLLDFEIICVNFNDNYYDVSIEQELDDDVFIIEDGIGYIKKKHTYTDLEKHDNLL